MKRWWRRPVEPRERRAPLRVVFVHTELLLGGAETLLLELMRHLDRDRFSPRLALLKRPGPLGDVAAAEIPVTVGWLEHKWDVKVIGRLARHLCESRVDAVITVGTGGDRMFWGRLAAWRARVPVILSAIHSTGYPHGIDRANRLLAPITDGFIGCARRHAEYLAAHDGCPRRRVFTIYNGVDTGRFRPRDRRIARKALGWNDETPIAGIVAALRPEKQHVLLVEAWRDVVRNLPEAKLAIIGEGDERPAIEAAVERCGLHDSVWLLGRRDDVEAILPALDVMALSSKMEANPASTLEASACGVAVVAPEVGSLPETVLHDRTGLLYPGSDRAALTSALVRVLSCREWACELGRRGRAFVESRFSLEVMVRGYETLIEGLYDAAWEGKRYLPGDLDAAMRTVTSKEPQADHADETGDLAVRS